MLTNRYVHGSNAAADDPLVWYVGAGTGTKRYLHADHLGSIVAATNPSAAPGINAYDEYGIPGASNVGRFQYTGQALIPELGSAACPGVYYYKARMYSPCDGRFLQTDPVGYEGGINLYAYVGDDPLNKADPSGRGWGDLLTVLKDLFTRKEPSPPSNLPHGPYEPKPGGRPGSYMGPKQPPGQGPRSEAQRVPPEGKGGPPGTKETYWKVKAPGEGSKEPAQRYSQSGKPISAEEAHPNPERGPKGAVAGGALEGVLDMLLKFPLILFPGQEQQIKCMSGSCDPA